MRTSDTCKKALVTIASTFLFACAGGQGASSSPLPPPVTVAIDPTTASLGTGATLAFAATVSNSTSQSVTWSVQEGASGGTVTSVGLYTAPSIAGTYHVTATSVADPSRSASATVAVTASAPPPVIASFTASPSSLAAGGGSTTLSWSTAGATSLSIDHGIGTVTGTSKSVSVTSTTLFTLTATNANGSSTSSTLVVVASSGTGVNPPSGARYAAMVAPVDGETFIGPTVDLRLVGAAFDSNNWVSSGPGGGKSQAAQIQFFVDGNVVLSVDAASSEYWVFKGFAPALDLAPGSHTVIARAIYTANPGPAATVDSPPVTITVLPAPAYAQVVEMTGDLTLAQAATWVGTSSSRVRVNGNGYRIVGSGSTAVNWQYVDFHDLGSRSDTSAPGVDLATSGNVTVRNCRFDYSNPVRFTMSGGSAATIRDNLWRSNMRQPLGQAPLGDSFPAVLFTGKSTGASVFAGNNVGAGWVDWSNVSNWTVGGETDADSNVLIGPRVGLFFDFNSNSLSSNVAVRRNFSHHVYYGGWSQGSNYELGGIPSLLAEHNVMIGSSWTVRGVGGEVRYNLLLNGGEDWLWADHPNGFVHHNVFVGGDLNRSGLYAIYGNAGIRVLNNTFDGLNSTLEDNAVQLSSGAMTLDSNIFMNLPRTPVSITGGTMTTDRNLFWNSGSPPYSDARSPAHDIHADPLLADPAAFAYEFDERSVWERTLTVHDILAAYRARYTPTSGSPTLDAGDSSVFGPGNDLGAIGAGASNAADLFGK